LKCEKNYLANISAISYKRAAIASSSSCTLCNNDPPSGLFDAPPPLEPTPVDVAVDVVTKKFTVLLVPYALLTNTRYNPGSTATTLDVTDGANNVDGNENASILPFAERVGIFLYPMSFETTTVFLFCDIPDDFTKLDPCTKTFVPILPFDGESAFIKGAVEVGVEVGVEVPYCACAVAKPKILRKTKLPIKILLFITHKMFMSTFKVSIPPPAGTAQIYDCG